MEPEILQPQKQKPKNLNKRQFLITGGTMLFLAVLSMGAWLVLKDQKKQSQPISGEPAVISEGRNINLGSASFEVRDSCDKYFDFATSRSEWTDAEIEELDEIERTITLNIALPDGGEVISYETKISKEPFTAVACETGWGGCGGRDGYGETLGIQNNKALYTCNFTGEANNSRTWWYAFDLETKENILVKMKYIPNFDIPATGEPEIKIYREDLFTLFPALTDQVPLSKYEKSSFDGCGELSKYKTMPWYGLFQDTASRTSFSLDKISDACYSENNKLFIAMIPGEYCGSGFAIGRYDIYNDILNVATLSEKTQEKGCLSMPNEFGKREGNTIKLNGLGGDAGCRNTMNFDYNFITNIITLTKECGICEGEAAETCTNY